MNQNKKDRFQIKDFISIGIYTAIYFSIVSFSNVIVFLPIPGYSYAFIPIIAALLSGTIYMLMVAKVPKFGAITIMGSAIGIFQFIIGLFPGALVFCIAIALSADTIAYVFNYKNKKGVLASYLVFSFSSTGPVLPLFLLPNMYVNHLVEQGRDAVYIENTFAAITQNTLVILVVGIIVAATIGGLFGQRMMKKHFEKAGII